MITAKHTPGPWIARPWQGHASTSVMANGQQIAECSGFGRDSADCLADARLIAAAPDLLAALQGLLERAGGQHWPKEEHAALCAIAKATGIDTLNERCAALAQSLGVAA